MSYRDLLYCLSPRAYITDGYGAVPHLNLLFPEWSAFCSVTNRLLNGNGSIDHAETAFDGGQVRDFILALDRGLSKVPTEPQRQKATRPAATAPKGQERFRVTNGVPAAGHERVAPEEEDLVRKVLEFLKTNGRQGVDVKTRYP